MAVNNKSATDFILDVGKYTDPSGIYIVQAHVCFNNNSTSNKYYTLLLYTDTQTDTHYFCKIYGPIGKWSAWTMTQYKNLTNAETAYDNELDKRRKREYKDYFLSVEELHHAQVCLRAIVRLSDAHHQNHQTWSSADYSIVRKFLETLKLSRFEMNALNFSYKSFK